jgi:hypothetical protein
VLNPGDRISFHVRDAYLPVPGELLDSLSEEVEVIGTVIERSDSGAQADVFAVIALGDNQTVVVPVSKVRLLTKLPVAS